MKDKSIKEKEYYREKIIEIIRKIESPTILEYLYIFIQGKVGRHVTNEEK